MISKRIVVAGGTGFLGRALTAALVGRGDKVVLLTRSARSIAGVHASVGAELARPPKPVQWSPGETDESWTKELEGAAAVVNLAGESIGGGRWTPERKRRLRDSRLVATRTLVDAMRACRNPPHLFVSASAVGYYGLHDGGERLTEASSPGDDFLARLCVDWEKTALEAAAHVQRVILVRSGVVLDRDEGALPRMLMPFKFFAGGPIGSGRQYISWIHIADWVRLVQYTIDEESVQGGPINATAPEPVTNAEFARAIGGALHRPALLRTPAFALRLMLGEMAESLVIRGQRVVPERATASGFRFEHAEVTRAMRDIIRRR